MDTQLSNTYYCNWLQFHKCLSKNISFQYKNSRQKYLQMCIQFDTSPYLNCLLRRKGTIKNPVENAKAICKIAFKTCFIYLVMYSIVHLQNKSSTWKENYVNCIGIMYPLCKYSRVTITSQQEAATAFRPLSLTKVSFLTHFFFAHY